MSINMTMPRLSDTMQQGTVVKWNVKPGQKVKSGDVVADIETDKATMELPTYDEGTVASLAVKEGESVPVGTLILVLAEAGEDPAALGGGRGEGAGTPAPESASTSAAPATPAGTATRGGAGESSAAAARLSPGTSPVRESGPPAGSRNGHGAAPAHAEPAGGVERIFASPLARKIAAERNVDLAGIEGSGPSGRIVRRDVEAAAEAGARPAGMARGGQAVAERAAATAAPVRSQGPLVPSAGAALNARRVPLSNMRRTIAARLVESKTTIPHYQVTVSVRMDGLLALRAHLNEQLQAQGVKLSVNDFLVRACALAMHQHPYVNARWVGTKGQEAIEYLDAVNIGMAIALPIALPIAADGTGGGLVVATIRQADVKGLRQLSSEAKALSEKARTRGLTLEEMSDSTFTISNLGMFGVDHFTAIINPPNVAILAVGASIEQPVVETGPDGSKRVGIGSVMSMTMSSDHRVVDGAMAAQYLGTVKTLLETPATLLV